METLPVYVPVIFELTVLLTFLFLARSSAFSVLFVVGVTGWLFLQAMLGLSGFYKSAVGFPPRFALALVPPLLFVVVLAISGKGRRPDPRILTLLHVVRVPVEIVLYWLMLNRMVPEVMTFEGRNFDILCGITAPFIFYFGYIRKSIGRYWLIAWNIVCLLLLGNIVVTAVFSL